MGHSLGKPVLIDIKVNILFQLLRQIYNYNGNCYKILNKDLIIVGFAAIM